MALADRKLKDNIVEYVLFYWQMEDLIRAANFDMGAINAFILSYVPDQAGFEEEARWFDTLLKKMNNEGLTKTGHIEDINEIIRELNYLHHTCLNIYRDARYISLFKTAKPNIDELRQKTGKSQTEVETMLNGMYGLLILRLKKTPVSDETKDAMKTMSNLLAYLSVVYAGMKKGEMNAPLN